MQKTQEGQNGHDRVGTTLATNKHEQACSVLLESTICLELLIKASFVEGMSEFLEGEVSLICRKIILIHGQNPGVCYLEIKGFK